MSRLPPVFVDDSGRRRRWVLVLGCVVSAVAAAYVVVAAVSILRGTDNGLGGSLVGLLVPDSATVAPDTAALPTTVAPVVVGGAAGRAPLPATRRPEARPAEQTVVTTVPPTSAVEPTPAPTEVAPETTTGPTSGDPTTTVTPTGNTPQPGPEPEAPAGRVG